ncbi:MAG: lipoate--protein ligase family protein [Candidatus Bathyarchaeia archaeon]
MGRLRWRFTEFDCSNPKMNLALEEAILRNNLEKRMFNTLILWQNSESVVVGIFNNVIDEVNIEVCKANNIEIVRRVSGGGAVYHDLGNLNISLILNSSSTKIPIDVLRIYEWFSEPVLRVIEKLGVNANFNAPNSIRVDGKKVSGMAIHFLYDALLVHCTLLIDTNLKLMSKVLLKMKDDVVNLSSIVRKQLSVQNLKKAIVEEFENYLDVDFESEKPTMDELNLAKELFTEKYNSNRWNLGKGSITIEIMIKDPLTSPCFELIKLVNEAILEIDENVRLVFNKFDSRNSYGNELWNLLPFLRINGNIKPFKEFGSKEEFIKFIKNNLSF